MPLDNITDAKRLINLAFGIDDTLVKMSGKPLSIGLEDRFKCISTKSECLEKVNVLVQRLAKLVLEDGRKPTTLKVFIRDYEKDKHDPTRKFCKQSRCVLVIYLSKQLYLGSNHVKVNCIKKLNHVYSEY